MLPKVLPCDPPPSPVVGTLNGTVRSFLCCPGLVFLVTFSFFPLRLVLARVGRKLLSSFFPPMGRIFHPVSDRTSLLLGVNDLDPPFPLPVFRDWCLPNPP